MSSVLEILFGAEFFAFVWWPAGVGIYFMIKAFSHFGKIHVVRFKKINGIRIAIASKWPKIGSESVRPQKGEYHTIEEDSFAFLERNGLATNPVMFVDTDSTRPLIPVFKDPSPAELASWTATAEEGKEPDPKTKPKGKLAMIAIPHNSEGEGKEYSLNPHTEDMDDFAGRKTIRQLVVAGAMGNASLIFILLAIGVGAGIGYALSGIANPQHIIYACPPLDSCTAPVSTATTSAGTTITATP